MRALLGLCIFPVVAAVVHVPSDSRDALLAPTWEATRGVRRSTFGQSVLTTPFVTNVVGYRPPLATTESHYVRRWGAWRAARGCEPVFSEAERTDPGAGRPAAARFRRHFSSDAWREATEMVSLDVGVASGIAVVGAWGPPDGVAPSRRPRVVSLRPPSSAWSEQSHAMPRSQPEPLSPRELAELQHRDVLVVPLLHPLLRLDCRVPHLLWVVDSGVDEAEAALVGALIARNSDILRSVTIALPLDSFAGRNVTATVSFLNYFLPWQLRLDFQAGRDAFLWARLDQPILRHHVDACFARNGVLDSLTHRIPCPPVAAPSSAVARLARDMNTESDEAFTWLPLVSFFLQHMPFVAPSAAELSHMPSTAVSHALHLGLNWQWQVTILSAHHARQDRSVSYFDLPGSGNALCGLFRRHNVSKAMGVLVLDLGSNDQASLEGMLRCGYAPSMICFSFSRVFTAAEDCEVNGLPSGGAMSLGKWTRVLRQYGYGVVELLRGSGIAIASDFLPFVDILTAATLYYSMDRLPRGHNVSCMRQTRTHDGPPPPYVPGADRMELRWDVAVSDAFVVPSRAPVAFPQAVAAAAGSRLLPVLYIINLPHREDRREAILRHLRDNVGYPEDRIRIVPGVRAPDDGSLGCTLAHMRALQRGFDEGAEHIVILEDDAELVSPSNFVPSLRSILGVFHSAQPFDVFLLATRCALVQKVPALVEELLEFTRVRGSLTRTGYIVARHYVPAMMAMLHASVHALVTTGLGTGDLMWQRLQLEGAWYTTRPPLARQVSGFSDILGNQAAYKQVDYDNFWEALATCV